MAREFKTVVKNIAHAEKDVDKVLKAARLTRHEKPDFDYELLIIPMTMLFAFATFALLVFSV